MTTKTKAWTRAAFVAMGLTLFMAQGARAATSDPWITTKAKLALLTTDNVSSTAINVDTINGEVTLHGKVASQAEKTKAEQVVRDIDGVTGVRNLLQVVSERQEKRVDASDSDIKTKVEKALEGRPALEDVSVQSVNNGVVLLSGDVKSLGAHLQAVQVASTVPGVRRVASEIKSPNELGDAEIYSERAPATGQAGRSMKTTASDMRITSAVKLRLLADERTPGLGVNVDTMDGTVSLFGTVDSATAKAAAEEDARRVSGVTKVVNDLQIVPESKQKMVEAKDEEVQKHVEDALSKRQDLRDADIDVEVKNGVARLTGTVPNESQRLAAAVTARTADGVRAVRDELRIETQ